VTVSLWRVAADTPQWSAEDMAGKGAAHKSARWNNAGEHVTYTATSVSLAAWETRAHFGKEPGCPGTGTLCESTCLIMCGRRVRS
jgi:RES domain-containing protein